MLEFTSYIMDVEEAKDQLIDVVKNNYKSDEIIYADDLKKDIERQFRNDFIHSSEATDRINRYGLNAAINELVEYDVDLNNLDTMNFSTDLVKTLAIKQLQELADWVMGNEPITAENVIQSINILLIAEF